MHGKLLKTYQSFFYSILLRLFLVTTAGVCVTASVFAKEQALHLKDAGALLCSESVKIYENIGNETEKTAILHWLSGYAIGQAEARKVIDVFPIVNTGEFVQMVLLICTENTDVRLKTAAEEAINRLQPLWVADSSETVEINDGVKSSILFSRAILPLQNLLQKNGATLLLDGIYQEETGAAIESLLSTAGFPKTQHPTGAALYLLTLPSSDPRGQ